MNGQLVNLKLKEMETSESNKQLLKERKMKKEERRRKKVEEQIKQSQKYQTQSSEGKKDRQYLY